MRVFELGHVRAGKRCVDCGEGLIELIEPGRSWEPVPRCSSQSGYCSERFRERGIRLRLNGQPQRGWSVFINQLRSLLVARLP
jgi:hypothetical protein